MADDNLGQSGPSHEPLNPWTSIWLQPRQTIRQIVDTDPTRHVLWLAMGAGAVSALMPVMKHTATLKTSAGLVMLVAVIGGAIVGFVGLYVTGWLYRWVGSWMGGQAKSVEVRAALAWGSLPAFAEFVIWLLVMLATVGSGAFGNPIVGVVMGVVATVLGIWQLVLQCHTLGEVHRFSAWKGFGTFLIPGVLLVIPLLAAIAIPNVLRGRQVANEAATIGNLRALVASLEMERSINGTYPSSDAWGTAMYPSDKEAYGPPSFHTASNLSKYPAQGYVYTYRSDGSTTYALTAVPQEQTMGTRSFYADHTGLIHHCLVSKLTRTTETNMPDASLPTIDQDPVPCK